MNAPLDSSAGTGRLQSAGLQLSTVSDSMNFSSLRAEWTALCLRSDHRHLYSTFDWWLNAWQLHAEQKDCKLRLVVGRLDGRLVLAWPLMTDRRVLRMLSAGMLEYRGILLEPSQNAGQWVHQAWSYVRSTIDADVYLFQDFRLPNALADQFAQESSARPVGGGWCSVIRLDRFAGWNEYASTRPKSLVADQRRQWKRIERDAPGVSFRLVEKLDEVRPVMDWISHHKIIWAEARQIVPTWFVTASIQECLRRAAETALIDQRLVLATLADDNRIIAASWGFLCGNEFLLHAFAYDAAYATYSPSRLLQECLIRHCFQRGVCAFDFMTGDQTYKRIWATDFVRTESYIGPLNWRGACLLRMARFKPSSSPLPNVLRQLYRALPRPVRNRVWRVVSKFQMVNQALSSKPPEPPPTWEMAGRDLSVDSLCGKAQLSEHG